MNKSPYRFFVAFLCALRAFVVNHFKMQSRRRANFASIRFNVELMHDGIRQVDNGKVFLSSFSFLCVVSSCPLCLCGESL